jgi:hypothetical protein
LGLPDEILLLLSAGILRQDYKIKKPSYQPTQYRAPQKSFLIDQVRRRLPLLAAS